MLLVACRSDRERERDGTPALTAGAIGRGVAVPLPYISGPLSRNVRNAEELAYQIAATVATGLAQVMLLHNHLELSAGDMLQRLNSLLTFSGGSKHLGLQGDLQNFQRIRTH